MGPRAGRGWIALLASVLTFGALAPAIAADVSASALKRLQPWKEAKTPTLELASLDGPLRGLTAHRGRVVLVNFWATWCEPCREEMPAMQRLKQRMGDSLAVVAVNIGEGEPRIRDFLQKLPVDFDILLDRDKSALKAWSVRILPTTFLVGPDGRVRRQVIGEYDWSSEEAVRAVEALLKK